MFPKRWPLTFSNFRLREPYPRVRGKLELDAISMLSSKVDAMSQKLEHFNVNFVSSCTPSLSCDKCGSIDHLTVHCQLGSPFAQDVSDQVNYVNNCHLRPTNDTFSSRSYPNFAYKSNAPLVPQMNFRPPRGFQRPSYPQQAPKKSNLESMMENMFLAQQK